MDIELRRLERLAAGNDPDALRRYKRALRRSGEWLTLITLGLMNDNPTEALIDLARVRPSLRGDIARQAGIAALQQTGIWHGLCILSEEDYAFHLNAEANGFWGKRSDYPDNWTIGNIRDDIDLCSHLYSFTEGGEQEKNYGVLWVEFNLGEGPYSVYWKDDEVNWGIGPEDGGLLGTFTLFTSEDFDISYFCGLPTSLGARAAIGIGDLTSQIREVKMTVGLE